MVKYLLSQNAVSINHQGRDGHTGRMTAVIYALQKFAFIINVLTSQVKLWNNRSA